MIEKLSKICKTIENIDLTTYNTYKLHSKAKCIVFPSDSNEFKETINLLKENNEKFFILGNGSNVILPSYYDGVIIKLDSFNKYKIEDNYVYAECGCMINKLALELVNSGYSCLEWASGIPGTIGGCVYNNAGAYNSSISDVLTSASVYNIKTNEINEMNNNELNFEYRDSLLKKNKDLIVLSCKLKLTKSNINELKTLVTERTNRRLATQDLSHPSCGSVFRNPDMAPAGKLIEDAGLKGYKIGDAMVSKIHANFIINDGNATYDDIVNLIDKIKKDIKDIYKIDLVLEQEIIK